MDTNSFSFELPAAQVAQHPRARREDARLMVVSRRRQCWQHRRIADLPQLLDANSLLVLNNSKVRPCRLQARSLDNGAQVEFLLLRNEAHGEWLAQCSRAKKQHLGRRYALAGGVSAEVTALLADGQRRLLFTPAIDDLWLDRHGEMPLPPYIKRLVADPRDRQRYQPVYARHPGSAAAPTAGLHFSQALLRQIADLGVQTAFVTLHVGPGTFAPIRSQQIEDHRMHTESYSLDPEQADLLNQARRQGRRIIAVGTTSLRVLESCYGNGSYRPGSGETDLYIHPGYTFVAIDELITNFHTPRSSLLVLVSALAGWPLIEAAYNDAVGQDYRFFSYGDAMWIRN